MTDTATDLKEWLLIKINFINKLQKVHGTEEEAAYLRGKKYAYEEVLREQTK